MPQGRGQQRRCKGHSSTHTVQHSCRRGHDATCVQPCTALYSPARAQPIPQQPLPQTRTFLQTSGVGAKVHAFKLVGARHRHALDAGGQVDGGAWPLEAAAAQDELLQASRQGRMWCRFWMGQGLTRPL